MAWPVLELKVPAGQSVQFRGREIDTLLNRPNGQSRHPAVSSAYWPGKQPTDGLAVGMKVSVGDGVGKLDGAGMGMIVGCAEGNAVDGRGVGI